MKQTLALVITYLALAGCALAAPIIHPGALEASLDDSVRSFESAYSQLDDKMQTVTEKSERFGRREKWVTGIAAGLTMLGTGGFIVSSSIPIAVRRQKQAQIAKLRLAVERANAAAQARTSNVVQAGRVLAKRGKDDLLKEAAEVIVGHREDDAESFHSAISRTPSMRIGDFEDHVQQHTPVYPSRLARSQSAPSSRIFSPHQAPGTPSRPIQDSPVQDNIDTHERIASLEAALLDLRKHQHDSLNARLSPWTKALIAAGLVNAAGGIVSAELSVENTIEGYEKAQPLPDVSNLDPKTCGEFAKRIDGLDCSKAHGVA